jgi:LysR family transcriptional regulator, cyn operon transcriptional activator
MDIRHLRYFVAIADAGTMAAASEKVFVTQSTLSHQLAQLESELNVQLFERVGRGLALSAVGKEYLGYARGVLLQIEEGKNAVANLQNLAIGSLRIGVIHSFVTHLVPDASAAFLKKYPQIRLYVNELTALEIEAQVETGELDMGFAFSPLTVQNNQVVGEHLFDDVLALAVPVKHDLAKFETLKMKQLAGLPLAMMSQRYATRRLLDSHFARVGINPKIAVEIDSVDALKRLVELGVSCAFLPLRTTHHSKLLRLVQITDPKPVRGAGLVWRNSGFRSAAALAFTKELKRIVCADSPSS